jgi:putative ABC transport system substrate-binding protein
MPDPNLEVAALVNGFAKRGYRVGHNLVFERQFAHGDIRLLPALADELVASRVDVIVTFGFPAALAAKQRSGGIPVVVTRSGDPVATGLVASLARPGGSVTGISDATSDLGIKRLELLRETVPALHKVAFLWNADDPAMTLRYQAAEAEASRRHIVVQALGVREPNDFATAFATMTRDRPDAIVLVTDVLTLLNRQRVYEFATANRIPAIYEHDHLVRDGGLLSYGPDLNEVYDRAADLVVRIFKGAKPADLPLEQPSRIRCVVNLKTAKAQGVSIPESILLRADEVIE